MLSTKCRLALLLALFVSTFIAPANLDAAGRDKRSRIRYSPVLAGGSHGYVVVVETTVKLEGFFDRKTIATDVFLVGMLGKVYGHVTFGEDEGRWKAPVIFPDGTFRMDHESVKVGDGPNPVSWWVTDAYVYFSKSGEILKRIDFKSEDDLPHFEYKLTGSDQRVSDIYFFDEQRQRHGFAEAAGINSEVCFVYQRGFPMPKGKVKDHEDKGVVLAVIPYPPPATMPEGGVIADWYLWQPLKNEAKLLWIRPLGSVVQDMWSKAYHFNPKQRSIFALRPVSGWKLKAGDELKLEHREGAPYLVEDVEGVERSEFVKLTFAGEHEVIAGGEFSQCVWDDGVAYVCGTLDGADRLAVSSLHQNGSVRNPVNTDEEVAAFRIDHLGWFDVRLKGEEGYKFTWRYFPDLKRLEPRPADEKGYAGQEYRERCSRRRARYQFRRIDSMRDRLKDIGNCEIYNMTYGWFHAGSQSEFERGYWLVDGFADEPVYLTGILEEILGVEL